MRAAFRQRYGAGPLHLALHLLMFAVAAFALDQIFSGGHVRELLEWYVGFAIIHDLLFIPAYSIADRVIREVVARLPHRHAHDRAIPIINHVRAPALISGLLLILYAPLISGKAEAFYPLSVGHNVEGYLRNWLLISLALFLGSGIVYAVRVWRRRRGHG